MQSVLDKAAADASGSECALFITESGRIIQIYPRDRIQYDSVNDDVYFEESPGKTIVGSDMFTVPLSMLGLIRSGTHMICMNF